MRDDFDVSFMRSVGFCIMVMLGWIFGWLFEIAIPMAYLEYVLSALAAFLFAKIFLDLDIKQRLTLTVFMPVIYVSTFHVSNSIEKFWVENALK
ncbi:hypothetical protein NT6N_23690 [Oceaniferula spumae]|uniref:Uncharacterized protein n=1 Tax=Oceaniferula spumae TaxID=2979115 RepID=A0AAT9FMV3_9BACT